MDVVLFLLVLCPSLALCQVPPSHNIQGVCAQAGRNSVAQCFKSNGGFQMTEVIKLLSNRTQRPLSLNSDQTRRRICQNQSEIITCLFKNITDLQNTQHCPTQNDFVRLEQETVGFINRIQTSCELSQALCTSLADCQVFATHRNQTHAACAPVGRNTVAMCFQSNGGFTMQNVITLLSNSSQGTLPPVVNQLRENMCSNLQTIKICVLSRFNNLHENQRCSSAKGISDLEQNAMGLIEGIRQICGRQAPLRNTVYDNIHNTCSIPQMPYAGVIGVVNSSTLGPCLSDINDAMRNCFSQAGLNPDLYKSNETKLTDVITGANEEIVYLFCGESPKITTCFTSSIMDLRVSQRCPPANDVVRLEQEATLLINEIRKLCEREVVALSTSTPCLPYIIDAMRNCFTKVGLNPDLFNNYETEFPDAFFGENEEMAHLFCRIRPHLFECLQGTPDDCPEAEYTMAAHGFDRNSMENATNILCLEVDLYIKGLNCFRKTTVQTGSCPDRTDVQGTNLMDRQHQLTDENGVQKFCMERIQNLECHLRLWRDQCENPNSVKLKNEIECSLLPTRCLRESLIQTWLRDTCAMKNFARGELRSDATSSILTFGNIPLVVLSSLVLLLGRKL